MEEVKAKNIKVLFNPGFPLTRDAVRGFEVYGLRDPEKDKA